VLAPRVVAGRAPADVSGVFGNVCVFVQIQELPAAHRISHERGMARRQPASNHGVSRRPVVAHDSLSKHTSEVLSTLPQHSFSPHLSRDNRQVFFMRGDDQADIYMLSIK
jgi:hypothetical protein